MPDAKKTEAAKPRKSLLGKSTEHRPAGRFGTLPRFLRLTAAGCLVIVLVAMLYEENLIFLPSRYPEGDWTPTGLDVEDVYFKSEDGTRLHGWYVPCAEPRAVLLYCHGNAGNLSGRADLLRYLNEQFRVSVFIFDYRGYGKSEGHPKEKGVLADARAARACLAEQAGIDQEQIVLMGRSLGGAVAVDLAAEIPAKGLILENTFTSMPDVAAHHYPFLPVRLLMKTRLNSIDKIGRYRGPLLQCHGDADDVVPFELGRRLHEAAVGRKVFIKINGGNHNDPQTREYYEALDRFLGEIGESG